ncbi:MAG: ABC transporter permease subunit, partial [Chloroflexi bacterium]|nr:ABC transporter permease subunit [Chloroflexota bacterium]
SILVSSLVFQSQVSQYNESLRLLQALGKEPVGPAPELFPLNLLRGVIDYIEIIGAVLGMLLGYLTVSREKNTRTLKLILTRPVGRMEIVAGKFLGNGIFIALTLLSVGVFSYLGLLVVGGVALSPVELLKLGVVLPISFAYIMTFFSLTFFLSLSMKTISHALMISFVIWLLVVLILPQIGDTMDPDNQVPGGFFSSMHLTKIEEKQVMANFNNYETIRTSIEQLSITKHYERASFAILGIKKEFNAIPLADILASQWVNLLSVFGLFAVGLYACGALMSRRRKGYASDLAT